MLEKVMVWFRDYKMPDGKPANKFGYDSKPQNKEVSTKPWALGNLDAEVQVLGL